MAEGFLLLSVQTEVFVTELTFKGQWRGMKMKQISLILSPISSTFFTENISQEETPCRMLT
eukprot:789643-Karenia_brevis.AAC.1